MKQSNTWYYKEINKNIRKKMRRAKEEWIDKLCNDVDEDMTANNSGLAFDMLIMTLFYLIYFIYTNIDTDINKLK